MKIPFNWLAEHLDTIASVDDVCKKLTDIGFEVEEVIDYTKTLKDFTVAYIVSVKKHPNADSLQVCTVETIDGTREIVCGASNAREGIYVVYASEGMYIPGIDVTLKKASIRGVESFGMMLSEREIGISDEHNGIIELSGNPVVGSLAITAMGIDDAVIDISITPNRGDCISIRGIARDLSATGIGDLKPLDVPEIIAKSKSPITVSANKEIAPLIYARVINNVKNTKSPVWLEHRLKQVGIRSVSALVDITNYIMHDLGRPLHFFDADSYCGNLKIDYANNEKFIALNNKEYTLDEKTPVVYIGGKVGAIAGIIGGFDSGCSLDTTSILMEVAYFEPNIVAEAGRKYDINSDARYRFERGIDKEFLADATEIATKMVLDICGGEPMEIAIAGSEIEKTPIINLDLFKIERVSGIDIEKPIIIDILTKLGFNVVDNGDNLDVETPSWRHDIEHSTSFIEEIIRIYGLDKIEPKPLKRQDGIPTSSITTLEKRRFTAKRVLANCGLNEAITMSFISKKQQEFFNVKDDGLEVDNPISSDLVYMRPSVLVHLLSAVANNSKRTNRVNLFEVGPEFISVTGNTQEIVVGGVLSGLNIPKHALETSRNVDPLDAKTVTGALLNNFGVNIDSLTTILDNTPSWYHPAQSASFGLGPKNIIAHIGSIHPNVLKGFDIEIPVVAFEIYIDRIPVSNKKNNLKPAYHPAVFQFVERDFAFIINKETPVEKIIKSVKGANKMIKEVRIFDIFENEKIGADKKSVAVSALIQPTVATLQDSEIEEICSKITAEVIKNTGGVLRTS